jgi:tetratricopeptide (TPR) repeat protein
MTRKSSAKPKQLSRREVRDLDIKIAFMQGVVQRDPSYIEALQILGDHYTQRGRYAESLKIDLQLSQLEPGNPLVFYNLACSYALTGGCEESAAALLEALKLVTTTSGGLPGTRTFARFGSIRLTGPFRTRSGK